MIILQKGCGENNRPWLPSRRARLARLKFCFFVLSIGMVCAKELVFEGIRIDERSPFKDEPVYGEQSWIFEVINVVEAWHMGYTGKNKRVRINDVSWDSDHPEWISGDRLIQNNKNAEDDYSCGDPNNRLVESDDSSDSSDEEIPKLNHGAAVTSVVGADGSNNFCGTGIAPQTKLSFCNYREATTNRTVLMHNILSHQLTANKNSYDISINPFAHEGCGFSTPRDFSSLHYIDWAKGGGDSSEERKFRERRQLNQQQEIELCPFTKFYNDVHNKGDDPCRVCTESDFDFVYGSTHSRDNIFKRGTFEKDSRTGFVSETCAASVRAYCLRNFRRNEGLCTEWIDVINYESVCQFKSMVGKDESYSLSQGTKEGRYEQGVTYIFSAGDSYGNGDNTNYQSYAKSRFVMTVGAIKLKEFREGDTTVLKPIHSTYSATGTSIFVVAPGGDYDSSYQHVGAIGGGFGECNYLGFGTSLAASVVGGVVALMLEAGPNLGWRDIRQIIVETSRPVLVLDEDGQNDDDTYQINAADVGYSDLYGFGLIDATKAVKVAEQWEKRGNKAQKEINFSVSSGKVDLDIYDDSFSSTTSTIFIYSNQNTRGSLESVSVYIKLRYFNRGNLRITLRSPSGTTSVLSPGGRNEYGQLDPDEWWEFLTLRNWGEVPDGTWKLSITDTKPGSGDVKCIDRPAFVVPQKASKIDFDLTCKDFESIGFCKNGKPNDDEYEMDDLQFELQETYVNMDPEDFYAALFEEEYGDIVKLSAPTACCACGGGIKPYDDEVNANQLEEWKIILGDGTPQLGTKRISNYDPFLPEVLRYEFIRCRAGEECCNGLETLCSFRVNEILWPTLHNGMNEFENGNYVTINKEFEIERALEAGYRAFKLDICHCNGQFEFCFGGMCSETGKRDITDVMFYFLEFLERNPSEIVIFIFEVRSDIDEYVDIQGFWFLLVQIRGFMDMVYQHDGPDSDTPWPTLGELKRNNQRIIMFHYNGPDCSEDPSSCPGKFHYYYDYIADNDQHIFEDPEEIENRDEACKLQRDDLMEYSNTFVGLNNFVTPTAHEEVDRINAVRDADRVNEYYAVKDYVNSCSEKLNRKINFIQNDWWGVGDVLRLTQDHNTRLELGEDWIAPTPSPTVSEDKTQEPTLFPTYFPTFEGITQSPTTSNQPSATPTDPPTVTDPCPRLSGDCRACKDNNEECLWCVSTETCYNRFIFDNIFDMDDEVIPCAGEDILNSFDTTCKARPQDFVSVYDDQVIDDLLDANETLAEEEDFPSSSPTKTEPTLPPTLPPIFVPLSPPTAVQSTSNFFDTFFGGSSSGSSVTMFPCVVAGLLSVLLVFWDI